MVRTRLNEAYDNVPIDYIKNGKKLSDYKYDDKIVIDGNTYINILSQDDEWILWGKIMVFDNADGTEVANANYGKKTKGLPLKSTIDVRSDKRRTGIASNIYQWIEQLTKDKLHPDLPHSKSAEALWNNPKRKFGFDLNEEESFNNDVDLIYQQHPELANIGTKQQYVQYLDTIYPNSSVKNIVYHGTNAKEIEGGRLRPSSQGVYGEGIYVQTKQDFTGTFGSNTLFLKIDTKKPFPFNNGNTLNKLWLTIRDKHSKTKTAYWAETAKEEFQDEIKRLGYDSIRTEEAGDNLYYILFNPEQTHILGTKEDIQVFQRFVHH